MSLSVTAGTLLSERLPASSSAFSHSRDHTKALEAEKKRREKEFHNKEFVDLERLTVDEDVDEMMSLNRKMMSARRAVAKARQFGII